MYLVPMRMLIIEGLVRENSPLLVAKIKSFELLLFEGKKVSLHVCLCESQVNLVDKYLSLPHFPCFYLYNKQINLLVQLSQPSQLIKSLRAFI